MLTGVSMEKHGVTWNDESRLNPPEYAHVMTLFELAKQYGMTTSLVAGKSKFLALGKPGTIDWFFAPANNKTTDDEVLKAAIEVVKEHQPQVLFVHFPGADTAGHALGWASPEQFQAIEHIDEDLGKLLDQLAAS